MLVRAGGVCVNSFFPGILCTPKSEAHSDTWGQVYLKKKLFCPLAFPELVMGLSWNQELEWSPLTHAHFPWFQLHSSLKILDGTF